MSHQAAPSAKPLRHALATAFQVFADYFPKGAEACCRVAPTLIALQPQRPDGETLLACRLVLQAAARDARNLRRAKLASLIERELCDLTTDILRRGPDASR